jgi:polysaccharide chain length determinant protein (PEP-CTERM system associated)
MNTTPPTEAGINTYMPILRRRATYIAVIAPLFVLLSVYLSFALTPLYESTATILLEPSSVDPKVVTTTVLSYSNQQIEIVEGRVLSIDALKQLVKQFDPYPGSPMSLFEKAHEILAQTTVERVDPVTLKPLQESNAFSLHYRNPDSERAAEVTKRLAALFLTDNLKTRQEAAQEAARFLQKQADDVSRQMRAIDEEIKGFKSQHGDALPEYVARNEASIDREQHDLENLQQEVLRAEEKESLLAVQLSQTSPNMITESGDMTDLPTVRARLAEAQQRYTPDHPEVKRLKQALQQLSSGQAAVAAGAPGGIVANANNPLYMTTASQLKSARNELASLRTQAARKAALVDQYEQLLRRTPGVEREYSEIMRRRTSLQTTYQGIQDKLQNANIAESFETAQGGERFTLIRAPAAGRLPVFPNRIGLILLGFVLGGLFSGIAVVMAEANDNKVRDVKDLPLSGDVVVLASIPLISNARDQRRRRLVFTSWAAAYTVALLVVGSVVVSAVK